MLNFREQLDRIGLSQYHDTLTSEGFDSWDTILDITETDLTTLGVKLGHRRKLQRAIAESRGQPAERALSLETGKISIEGGYRSEDSTNEAKESSGGHVTPALAPGTGTKRKYRRHPKADENAPERPPSAYVIFSNRVREELRGRDFSFTEIAKLVGERWQVLSPDIRDVCERQAATAKEKYYNELSEYKKTVQYSQYQHYLAEFKLKHAATKNDAKRSRIETETPQPGERLPPVSSNSFETNDDSRRSIPEGNISGHIRSLSNPLARQTPINLSNHCAPTTSTSPATFSAGLHSPVTQNAHSPRSSPPASSAVYSSYDLPHHARSGHSPAEPRPEEPTITSYFSMSSFSRWQIQKEELSPDSRPGDQFGARRPPRSASSIPSLVHTDTSLSSHTSHEEVLTPYMLPHFESGKGDRTLPPPIMSSASGGLASPHGPRPILPPPNYTPQLVQQDAEEGSQWPALLRATALARDAETQKEESAR
ncbi:hypothetical protein EJ08DRAFT_262648 [Tothia fuscella]|uniref:HMG box domain-containing protein n=1 Tax=Tothia fuscella TaxID=1048955 RepID=A0A9P4TXQ6_9PEZI|nr:hypothetical protein EJ08DRAFT_262648 [Tothia fuscella]